MTPERKSTLGATLLGAGALAGLVGAVFFPMLAFEFINLDVPEQLLANPHVRGLGSGNLWHILTAPCVTSYYPVRTLTLALDYQLWGLDPAGFKLTNGVLHLGNVLLVYGLILRLVRHPLALHRSHLRWPDVLAATVAAGLFAVHPVVVESVVWVAGREELLMTLGALACIHFHLTARWLHEQGGSRQKVLAFHALAAGSCALSCLSNAAGAVIPLLIVAWDLLTLHGPKLRKILYGTTALWLASAATIVVKWLGDRRHPDLEMGQTLSAVVDRLGHAGSVTGEAGALSVERLLLVLNVFWLNLETLVWPAHLSFSYAPVRPQDVVEPRVILGLAAAGLSCAALWALRRQKFMVLGLVWFGLALIPTAQIIPHHIHRADRFLYLPLVGLAVALAMGLRSLVRSVKGRTAAGGLAIACGLGLCLLGTLCAAQVQAWRSNLTLWENAATRAPQSAFAHQCFAKTLAGAGQSRRAFSHYEIALRLNPYNPKALKSLAEHVATAEDVNVRDYELAMRLAEWACRPATSARATT